MPPFLLVPHPPVRIKFFFLFPQTVTGGDSSTGFIELNEPAPSGGVVVNLKSFAPLYASVPTTVTVPAGVSCVTFPITTIATALPIDAFIVAKVIRRAPKARLLKVLPPTNSQVPSVQVPPPAGNLLYVAAMWKPTPPGTLFVFTYTFAGPGQPAPANASSRTPATFDVVAGAGSANTSQAPAINISSFAPGTYTVTGSCLVDGTTTANLTQTTFTVPA